MRTNAHHFAGWSTILVTFVEEASGQVTVKFSKSKGEAAAELIKYIKWVERQTGNPAKRIYSDGGGEYVSAAKEL